jgi:hypothetical protein
LPDRGSVIDDDDDDEEEEEEEVGVVAVVVACSLGPLYTTLIYSSHIENANWIGQPTSTTTTPTYC